MIRTFDALKTQILHSHGTLPKRLAQAARYAVEHPEDVAFGTAASTAEAAGVQPSTFVRLAQSLGFQGFSEFQAIFRERLRGRASSYEERLERSIAAEGEDGVQAFAVAAGALGAAAQSANDLLRKLDAETLDRAVEILAGAETIHVLAQRRSFPVASYLGYLLAKLRIRAVVAGSQSGIDPDVLALAGPKDAAISITFTPYAPATIEWTRIVAEQGVPVVGISDSAFSPVSELSKVWIEVVEADYEGFRSLAATNALCVGLAIATARRRRNAGKAPRQD